LQEKSKISLAEVYEQEYLKQKGDIENSKKVPGMLDPEDDGPPPEVESIKRSMKSLFSKLDTLTHFHYTPRMSSAEVKILRNAPTITMEEVAPIAMSDANLLAPQEIVDKQRSEEIGSTEKSDTDKNRERRMKKMKQRLREKEKEKKERLVEKLNPGLGNKHSKKKVLKDIEKAEKEGKLVTIKSKSKSVKSSSAFFNQLQNETMSTLKDQMSKVPKKKKAEKGLSGALLKL
jgi:U3 small nucleolar RNA-associated protein MPP10